MGDFKFPVVRLPRAVASDRNVKRDVGKGEPDALAFCYEAGVNLSGARVALHQPMIPQYPDIARLRSRQLRKRRKSIGLIFAWFVVKKESIDLGQLEARRNDVHLELNQFIELDFQGFNVPIACLTESIEGDRQGTPLGVVEMVNPDDGHLFEAEPPSRFPNNVPVHDATVAID